MSVVEVNAQTQMLAIVGEITLTTVVTTEINAPQPTAGWSSSPTTIVIAPAPVSISQVVVKVDTTLTETTAGKMVILITLAKGAHALALVHALAVATNLQVALAVDHAAPAVDALEAQATTVVAARTAPTTPITCTNSTKVVVGEIHVPTRA